MKVLPPGIYITWAFVVDARSPPAETRNVKKESAKGKNCPAGDIGQIAVMLKSPELLLVINKNQTAQAWKFSIRHCQTEEKL